MTARLWQLWAWPWRRVPVTVCQLCGSITPADAAAVHERWHAATHPTDR